MNLSLQSHRAGEVVIVKCSGQIVEGAESGLLRRHIEDLLQYDPSIVLDLEGVDFIDSSGLGLMVRLVMRLRALGGDLKLCALQRTIEHVLKVTRLAPTFDVHRSRAEALAAFGGGVPLSSAPDQLTVDVLCVHRSADVLAFVRLLMTRAGYGVIATDDIEEALAALEDTAPRAVLVDANVRASRLTASVTRFNEVIRSLAVVELPPAFSTLEAGAAGQQLLASVGAALGAAQGSVSSVG